MTKSTEKGVRGYLAVIGDIRRSRETTNRARLQKQVETGLQKANALLKGKLASRFVITLGDEFQGLLIHPESAMEALISLEAVMAGIEIRYGLGWGRLDTALRRDAIGMDGPCFHAARNALVSGKKLDRWVTVSGWSPERDEVLNGIFSLMGAVRAGWTPTQAATVALMRKATTQMEVAERRNVAVSAVNKALKGALYRPMIEAEHAVERILAWPTSEKRV